MFREGTEERIEVEVDHPCLPEWRRRIEEAEARGYFSEGEVKLALSWNTCAVGEAVALYAVESTEVVNYGNGGLIERVVTNRDLIDLGQTFYRHVF